MNKNKRLYPWQEECLSCWESAGYHGIISVVTGAGKTYFALNAAKHLITHETMPLRVRIVVPTISLAYQWRKAILEMYGNSIRIGLYFGEIHSAPSLPWMIYVINSARYALSRHVLQDMKEKNMTLLIADECHRYGSKENRKIFDFLKHTGYSPNLYASIGLSATPECGYLEDVLIPSLGSIIYTYSLDRAALERIVSEFSISKISLSFTSDEQTQYERLTRLIILLMKDVVKNHPELDGLSQTALFHSLRHFPKSAGVKTPEQKLMDLINRRRHLCYLAEARGTCVVDLIRELPTDGRILIFCEMIEQADFLTSLFREEGIMKVGRYHSEMTQESRKMTLERYRDHEIRILICCTALDEGLDVPDTAYGIVVSCSSAIRQRVQRLGRILRKSDGKNLAGLYYLYLDKTMEDPVYIEEISKNHPSCNMKYLTGERNLICPAYLELADKLLSAYKRQGRTQKQLELLRKNLLTGHIRNDWLMPADKLRELASRAPKQSLKNYWIVMEKMARLRDEMHEKDKKNL